MIQLNHYSIYVQLSNGEQMPLLAEDVAKSFCQSQPLSAGLEPWQVEEIAAALIHHLRVNRKQENVAFGDFIVALSNLVSVCGLNATMDSKALPCTNLYRLAQDTGYGFELAFFESVKQSIQQLRDCKARVIRFVGLRSCVKLLVGAKNWCKTCQRLNDEIVGFIRSHMLRLGESDSVTFLVAP